ncbi:hypothetical protein E2C01_090922 [Portunus trituberculatus]|uniref:Uncharacterized protein n=1 Tax=Portunus trituberculatus TaxID=210409 RepID=A0A5B7JLL6_PORTR|nr:hypothetical protein [Portunus trituberculatus]
MINPKRIPNEPCESPPPPPPPSVPGSPQPAASLPPGPPAATYNSSLRQNRLGSFPAPFPGVSLGLAGSPLTAPHSKLNPNQLLRNARGSEEEKKKKKKKKRRRRRRRKEATATNKTEEWVEIKTQRPVREKVWKAPILKPRVATLPRRTSDPLCVPHVDKKLISAPLSARPRSLNHMLSKLEGRASSHALPMLAEHAPTPSLRYAIPALPCPASPCP